MPGNPQIPLGSLNRLRGSVVVPNYPQLTVTVSYLAREAISLDFEGEGTAFLNTLTGAVTSPEAFVMCSISVAMLKSQGLPAQYETQRQLDSRIGQVRVILDSSSLPDYTIQNVAIENVRSLNARGDDPAFVAVLRGYYYVNSSLWDLT